MQGKLKSLFCMEGHFPESERAARETLALPIYPELTPGQQRKVAQSIQEFRNLRCGCLKFVLPAWFDDLEKTKRRNHPRGKKE